MKNIVPFVFFGVIAAIFISCDPASGIYVTNKTNYEIYIEYEFSDFDMPRSKSILNNNFSLNAGEHKPVIHLFPATSVIENLGFGPVKKKEDIVEAVDLIFNRINVYQVNNGRNILLYDKTYFLNKNNLNWHKYLINYSIEFVIR
jgi:hypothetical protein